MRSGSLDLHILKIREMYKPRRDVMMNSMEKYFPPGYPHYHQGIGNVGQADSGHPWRNSNHDDQRSHRRVTDRSETDKHHDRQHRSGGGGCLRGDFTRQDRSRLSVYSQGWRGFTGEGWLQISQSNLHKFDLISVQIFTLILSRVRIACGKVKNDEQSHHHSGFILGDLLRAGRGSRISIREQLLIRVRKEVPVLPCRLWQRLVAPFGG